MNPPTVIRGYIEASNAHDVKGIVDCFTDDAVVRDENAMQTIQKYKFQFKPLSADKRGTETILSVEVSGSFPGSPITLDYHFTIAKDKIQSLIIDS